MLIIGAETRSVVPVNDEAECTINMPHKWCSSLDRYQEIMPGKCA